MQTLTINSMPPWTVRRMKDGPTHIVACDGFTIIATVNHDYVRNAERLAAAPGMLDALKLARRHLYCNVTRHWLDPKGMDTACDCVSCNDSRAIELVIAQAEGR